MKRVPIAVIGLGFMGSRWARTLAENEAADVRIVSDARAEHGKTAADALGAEFVSDAREAASSPSVEGVVICTPEHLHLDAALAAIEAGKAVAVEKPLAHDLTTAEQIRDGSHTRGVPGSHRPHPPLRVAIRVGENCHRLGSHWCGEGRTQ